MKLLRWILSKRHLVITAVELDSSSEEWNENSQHLLRVVRDPDIITHGQVALVARDNLQTECAWSHVFGIKHLAIYLLLF
jgi:hypothetical protein